MKHPAQESAELQQDNPWFVCYECGEPVMAFNGNKFRTCDHTTADIKVTEEGIKALTNGI